MTQGTFPSTYKRKLRERHLQHLRDEIARGTPLSALAPDDRDLLHMETSEANVLYWKHENEIAETDERCMHCQAIARNIIAALRSLDPPVDDTLDNILCEVLEEADALPAVH